MTPLYSFENKFTDGNIVSSKIEPLVNKNHRISLEALALLFSSPAFFGDFIPVPCWEGISYVKDTKNPIQMASINGIKDSHSLHRAFYISVEAAIGQARTVAVALSAGIDSAAVLCTAHDIALKRNLDLIAITTEQISDDGSSNISIAENICRSISPDIRFIICSGSSEPNWDIRGPCLHALPRSTSHQVDLVYQAGGEVILTGSGSDELIGSTRYLLPHLPRQNLIKYISVAIENGWYGAVAECACLMARVLNKKNRIKLYMACNYIATKDIDPLRVLSKRVRSFVQEWEASYMRDLFQRHSQTEALWAELDAFDTLYPLQLSVPSNSIVRTEAPFLVEPFFSQALNTSLISRFDSVKEDSYRRRKGIAASLVRPEVLAHISQQKATFRKSIMNQEFAGTSAPLMVVESGLIDPDEMGMLENAEIIPTILAVERWLQGATARGFYVGCL